MEDIKIGQRVIVEGADGKQRELHALTGVIAGGDFAVVWACSPREWDAATTEGREAQGIPWPAEDVRVAEFAVA